VYRTTYRDKRTGEVRKAGTWIAAYWSPAKGKTVKEYGFATAREAQTRRADMMSTAGRLSAAHATAITITLERMLALVISDYTIHARRSLKKTDARQKLLFETFGAQCLARNIDAKSLAHHVTRMRADGYAAATINRSLALLKRGFRLAHRDIPSLEVPHIPMLSEAANVRQGFFDPGELARIVAKLPANIRPIVQVLHATGWRVGEVLSRKWSDVEDGFLHLRPGETKNGRGRVFPLAPDLEKILARLPKNPRPPAAPIFGAVTSGQLRWAWDDARDAAGLPGRILHDLRRTAARDLIRAGVDRDTAKRILGHETDSIFTRYRIVQGDDLKDAAAKLSAYRSAPPKKRRRAA
jgi:integrase